MPAGSVWARGNLDIAMGTHEVEAEGVEAVSRGAQTLPGGEYMQIETRGRISSVRGKGRVLGPRRQRPMKRRRCFSCLLLDSAQSARRVGARKPKLGMGW